MKLQQCHGKNSSNVQQIKQKLIRDLIKKYAVAELQKRSMWEFFKAAWPILEPNKELDLNWHQELICEYLELVADGKIKRLLINIAPRHLKSTLVSVCFPCWEWLKKPELRYLFLSYSKELSTGLSVLRRNLINSEWYQESWSDVYQLAKDNSQKTQFSNNYQGLMYATSFGGSVYGKGGDRIIIDDPHNPNEIESENVRLNTLGEFEDVTSTRLNDRKNGAIIVIMQRVHDQDVSGLVINKIKGYTHISLPTESEEKQVLYFPISDRQIIRQPGELLHPSFFGAKDVEEAKLTMGSYKYAGRHQQRPVPKEGGIIKMHWFKRYDILPHKFDMIIQSWDTANKASELNDPWCGQTWGILEGKYYLIDCIIQRMDYVVGKRTVINFALKYNPDLILIEDKSSGQSLIQELNQGINTDERKKYFNILAITPASDKITRMATETPAIETGRVYLPNQSSWLVDLEQSLSMFPNSSIDDPVDALSQFLSYAKKRDITGKNDLSVGHPRDISRDFIRW